VLRYLEPPLGHDQAAIETWYNHWIATGFAAFERLLAGDRAQPARFCEGDQPGLADIALGPAGRQFRTLPARSVAVTRPSRGSTPNCMKLDAFAAAHPNNQPDRDD
jgi:glutathione S-transferase